MKEKPLSGVRVLELGHILAGPYASKLLNDAGADVIKIEYGAGDPYRNMPPLVNGESLWFTAVNAGKKSITLDLKSEDGLRVFWSLIQSADVFIENFRPGITGRLGIDYDHVKARKSDIIYCSISGFGQTGSKKLMPGFDLIAQAEGGLLTLTGDAKGTPFKVGTYVADFLAGTYAAFAILLALIQREETKTGQFIDVSLLDSVVSLTGMFASFAHAGFAVKRVGNKDLVTVPYNVFSTSDGLVAVACLGDKIFQDFCNCLGLNSLLSIDDFKTSVGRTEHLEEIDETIKNAISKLSTAELTSKLNLGGIPYCLVPENIEELLRDTQILHRGMLRVASHPRMGEIITTGIPYKLSSFVSEPSVAAPMIGENTDEILKQLGYDSEQIMTLRRTNAI